MTDAESDAEQLSDELLAIEMATVEDGQVEAIVQDVESVSETKIRLRALLPNADHHDILGEQVVRCRWDKVNDFDVFNERGEAVKCPACGGSVRDEPSEHVEGLANVECRDCGEEYIRESYDFGDFPAGQQELKNSDHEVVARVK